MEYYPQESAMLDIARERIYDENLLCNISKARCRQIKTVLDACKSDTQMFVQFSELLYTCEKKLLDPEYQAVKELINALMA